MLWWPSQEFLSNPGKLAGLQEPRLAELCETRPARCKEIDKVAWNLASCEHAVAGM